MVEAGESNCTDVLKTQKLLKTRGAGAAKDAEKAVRMYMACTRSSQKENRQIHFSAVTGTHENWLTLRLLDRKYPELALAFNAVRCEVCMINGKNYGNKFTLRQIHQRAIGKIHGSIPITRHQTVHVLQFRIFDGSEDQCSGTDEPPGGLHLRADIANEVE